jgi:hypothetical protein
MNGIAIHPCAGLEVTVVVDYLRFESFRQGVL